MKEPIKVSVLIPAYNVERYIDQCLESVMHQTLREIQIIVVDDCSTDSTLAHIEAAAKKDSRIRVIRHEKNRKPLQSRKTAVLASRGEYVMFLDSDDYLSLDACRTVYESAVKSGADILHFGTNVENCETLTISLYDDGYERVQFPTWSDEDGQDDIVWYNAEWDDSGRWTVTVDLRRHKPGDAYTIHVYVKKDGQTVIADSTHVA